MIYCGIDASSSCTGLSFFNEEKELVEYLKVKSDKNSGFREGSCQMIERIIPIIEEYNPNYIYMEDVPTFARRGGNGGNVLKPLIALGSVQGLFYLELKYKRGYNLEFLDLTAWRKGMGFLNGSAKERNRDHQKDKAIKFVNEKYGLNLYYTLGKKSVKDDDDIAEAICICHSKINGLYDKAKDEMDKKALDKKNKSKNKTTNKTAICRNNKKVKSSL